ncbi:MAG: glycerate kinase [Spirochaetaceae bacterium]|jgi:glycerate kinase|nr:glycerate kinase [Spirochaetaceae bacterium]
MKIVVAADSFKGSLSSSELADSVEIGIRKIYPDAEVVKVPVADGGEGTVEALVDGTNGLYRTVKVNGPLMSPITALYGITGDGKTAVIEMASASGLPLIPANKRNPMKTTTYGTGELIKDALDKGCREFLIGIGGSATNDCGMGMMQALGMKFLDKNGKELKTSGENLIKTETIDDSELLNVLKDASFLIACDVDNPLYGENGAANVYGRQKGADDKMVKDLNTGLHHFSEIVKKKYSFDMNALPGAGAAGGLGGAFAAFLNGQLKPGIDIILDKTGLAEKIVGADFVITGEGRIDFQSVMGKTPVGVSKLAAKRNIPVIAIAGAVADDASVVHDYGINSLFSIMNYPIELEDAMAPERAKIFVEKNIEEIFR